MRLAQKDLLLGAIYIGFGVIYGVYTLYHSPLGTPTRMGPGFFPVVLCVILIGIGAAVALKGLAAGAAGERIGAFAWRGLFAISAATVTFSVIVNGAGIIIATLATAVVASLASNRVRPLGVAVTAVSICVFCTIVFHYILRLPIGLLGSWFR